MVIENEKKLSLKGLGLSVLAVVGLEIINQLISYYFDFAFLQTYFYVGWVIYAGVFGTIYQHFKTGNETIIQYLIVGIVNILVINIVVYCSYILMLTAITGSSLSEMLVLYSLPNHFSVLYTQSVSLSRNGRSQGGIGIPGWIFEVPGYFVMLYFSYRIMSAPSKEEVDDKFKEFEKTSQGE